MAGGITWYDVLGVTAGASADTLRYAYEQRLRQLGPGIIAGAPSPVAAAAGRARDSVEVAWLVLGDPEARRDYDKEIGLHRRHGLRGSSGFAEGGWHGGGDPYDLMRTRAVLRRNPLLAFQSLANWMAPLPVARRHRLILADLRGLFFKPCQAAATMAGLRLDVERLTADPAPVEGLVVAQSPDPGAELRRGATLTVRVWHPDRSQAPR